MLLKIFKHGSGGSKGVFNYLLGADRKREHARLLRGNIQQTSALIDTLSFTKRYKSGCLSFEEPNIPEAAKEEIMDIFEQTMFAGLDHDQYDITWIEHTDKGRLELNFVIPQVELTTGKRLNPYYYMADKRRLNAFRDVVNFGYGYSDPTDPSKTQVVSYDKSVPDSISRIKMEIDEYLTEQVLSHVIQNRESVVSTLEGMGYQVVRQTKKSISIANPLPNGKRNIRLTGALYAESFSSLDIMSQDKQDKQDEYLQSIPTRHQNAIMTLEKALLIKQSYNDNSYRRDNQPRPRSEDDSSLPMEVIGGILENSPYYIEPKRKPIPTPIVKSDEEERQKVDWTKFFKLTDQEEAQRLKELADLKQLIDESKKRPVVSDAELDTPIKPRRRKP